MLKLLNKKNNDYTAGSQTAFANFEGSKEYGIDPLIGLCLRMHDKTKRIQTFCQKGFLDVDNESVEDAFKDLIGYSVIALGMIHDSNKVETQPSPPSEDADRIF